MTEVNNLTALKSVTPTTGAAVYVKGHTSAGDGGGGFFLWRTEGAFLTTGQYKEENNGTIIKANSTSMGKWVRQYEDYINVLFFGAFGTGGNYTTAIQAAIDFAKLNTEANSLVKGSTVYIPNGNYMIDKIILKNGVSIIGESLYFTNIFPSTYAYLSTNYIFYIEDGPVSINISNLRIDGSNKDVGCFLLEAKTGTAGDGGLWYSTFKNILIQNFYKISIYIKGGGFQFPDTYTTKVNQFTIFENVRVYKGNTTAVSFYTNSLKMSGQNGQISFINCQFDGYRSLSADKFDKWYNVEIVNDGEATSNVVTFLNCTIQDSDYGIFMNYVENITIDNCWFENLGVGVMLKGDFKPSKSINILNNRFVNAAGFGSLDLAYNLKVGYCISVSKSAVNIYNNFNSASVPNNINNNSLFIYAFNDVLGVNCYNNSFRDNNVKLYRTSGIVQNATTNGNIINCLNNKFITASSNTTIAFISSAISAGETITIKANGTGMGFNSTGNILLENLSDFFLESGDIATFIKLDYIGSIGENYQLLSFAKNTP